MRRSASRLTTFSTAITAVLLSACSSIPTAAPTTQRIGQGWVVTRATAAAQLIQACPESLVGETEGLFAPSRQQIDELEATLPSLAPLIADAGSHDRQYVGVIAKGSRFIVVRGVPSLDLGKVSPTSTLLNDCNIGWEALFNPSTRHFENARLIPPPPITIDQH